MTEPLRKSTGGEGGLKTGEYNGQWIVTPRNDLRETGGGGQKEILCTTAQICSRLQMAFEFWFSFPVVGFAVLVVQRNYTWHATHPAVRRSNPISCR